jgi:pimeloyl-ACP methyl ester carboxylesterase
VVRDHGEVERPLELQLTKRLPARIVRLNAELLAEGEAVSLVGRDRRPLSARVERVLGVGVGIAEVGILQRISPAWIARRLIGAPRQHPCDEDERTEGPGIASPGMAGEIREGTSTMNVEPSEEREHLRLAVELSGLSGLEIVIPAEHHAVVSGTRLHYLDWGGGGLPTLLLHGGGLNAHTWDVVALALRGDYRCIALDQRGHGDSEWSPESDYSPEAHLRDIQGFIDLLGLERLLLVGQSMGAMNGFFYATRHSDRLRGLVLIDAGPNIRTEGAQRIGEFIGQTAEADSIDELVKKALLFNPLRDPRLLRRSLLYNYRRLPSGRWARKNDIRHFGQANTSDLATRLKNSWQEISRVTCPTLVVRGALSDIFLDEDAESFAAALPNARWVRVEGAGHTVQGDNPRGLHEELTRFFAAIPS